MLLAEDDVALRETLAMALRADGHEVVAVEDGFDLLGVLESSLDRELGTDKFDLVISDIRMPGMSGLQVFAQMQHQPRVPPVVFMTAFGDEDVHKEAIRIGAVAVLNKPFDLDELRGFVGKLLAGKRN